MKEVEEMKQRIEAYKADRVAKGLPPSPPDPFVPIALATVLNERCVPLFEYLAKYTKLCDDADAILPANIEIFERYEDYLTLIGHAGYPLDAFAIGVLIAKRHIKNADRFETSREYVRQLLQALEIAKRGYNVPLYISAYDSRLLTSENTKLQEKTKREYERLKSDDAALVAEVERLLAHYETIKHLY